MHVAPFSHGTLSQTSSTTSPSSQSGHTIGQRSVAAQVCVTGGCSAVQSVSPTKGPSLLTQRTVRVTVDASMSQSIGHASKTGVSQLYVGGSTGQLAVAAQLFVSAGFAAVQLASPTLPPALLMQLTTRVKTEADAPHAVGHASNAGGVDQLYVGGGGGGQAAVAAQDCVSDGFASVHSVSGITAPPSLLTQLTVRVTIDATVPQAIGHAAKAEASQLTGTGSGKHVGSVALLGPQHVNASMFSAQARS
jgi:hypothetical protein